MRPARVAEAVETLRHPPLVGEVYLVEVLTPMDEAGRVQVLPVLGPEHADPDLLVPANHRHFDGRFLQKEAARFLVRTHCADELAGMRLDIERIAPDHLLGICRSLLSGPEDGPVSLAQLRCLRVQPADLRTQGRWMRFLERKYAGSCLTPEGRCPHQLAPLLSQPIRAGRRVCPNHGLCFDRAGRQVARSEAELQRLERVIVLTGDPRNRILP